MERVDPGKWKGGEQIEQGGQERKGKVLSETITHQQIYRSSTKAVVVLVTWNPQGVLCVSLVAPTTLLIFSASLSILSSFVSFQVFYERSNEAGYDFHILHYFFVLKYYELFFYGYVIIIHSNL